MDRNEINVIEVGEDMPRPLVRRRIDPDKLLRYRAKSGHKVVLGKVLPQTDAAITRAAKPETAA